MNNFEVVLLFNPELSNQILKDELEKFKNQITNNSGKIINTEDWGLRDLSYNIKKFKKAFYSFLQLEMNGINIDSIKKDLNQNDRLLRYLFVKVDNHQELPTKLNYEKK